MYGYSLAIYIPISVSIVYSNFPYSDRSARANSGDPDQTAPKEQSDQGLQYLPFHR